MPKSSHSAARAASHSASEPSAALVPFNFRGDLLDVATTPDGECWVVLARLCEPFDLDAKAQRDKVKGLPWARWAIIPLPSTGGIQATLCLNIRSVAGWLFTINAGKVAPHLREKLALYQRECADVLADHFLGRRGDAAAALAPIAAALEGIRASNDALVAVVDALSRRMDIIEAQQASRPANDGDGIGQSAAERHILAPLRRIARLKHAALHAPKPGAMRKIRMIEERSLRRELDYQMEKRAAWSKLPPARLAAAKAAIDRMTDNAENLAMIAGVTSPELLGPLFEKVTDPRRMN